MRRVVKTAKFHVRVASRDRKVPGINSNPRLEGGRTREITVLIPYCIGIGNCLQDVDATFDTFLELQFTILQNKTGSPSCDLLIGWNVRSAEESKMARDRKL